MIPAVKHSEKGKTMETVKRSGVGEGGGWMNRQSTEDFEGSENTVYDTIRWINVH